MYDFKYSKPFKKDLKKIRMFPHVLRKVETILHTLSEGAPLDKKYKNHPLKGEFNGCLECHVAFDLLLIYKKNEETKTICILRIGSHAELF